MSSAPEFIQLARQHQKIIYKVCHVYVDAQADRDDLFQEILLHAWKAWPAFRHEARFSTWLYQIALNTAITFFRQVKKQPVRQELDSVLTLPASADDDTEQQFQAMYLAIAELNKIDKAVVMLYLEQYDYKSIGQMLGMTDNTVAVRMKRIKVFLKEAVKRHL